MWLEVATRSDAQMDGAGFFGRDGETAAGRLALARPGERAAPLAAHAARLVGIGGFRCLGEAAEWTRETADVLRLPDCAEPTLESLLAAFPAEARAEVAEHLAAAARGIPFDAEILLRRDANRPLFVRLVGEPDPERAGGVRGAVQDASRRPVEEGALWTLANVDDLTGLWNRKRFGELVAAACARPDAGLLFVDVDRIKDVNDTWGHSIGDALIAAIGARIAARLGPDAHAARLGGDRFGIVLTQGADAARMAEMAARLLGACDAEITLPGGHALVASVSIGGALAADAEGPDGLRIAADTALDEAKSSGRGCYVPYRPAIRIAQARRLEEVREAASYLESGAVEPRYMPVVRLSDRYLCGFEALARFVDGEAAHSPAQYPAALADARLGHQLTTRMLEGVARDLAAFAREGIVFDKVGVNVTLADFRRGDLEERIARIFGEAGVAQEKLVIEVTEQVFLSGEADCVARTAARLREKGVRISLDDFGTGFASLTHLRTFPLDTIKIDRSFVSRITEDAPSLAIVGGLIELASRLSIDLVAEGIETRAQLELLERLGCPFGQGYLFAPPLAYAQAGAFVRRAGAEMRTPLAA